MIVTDTTRLTPQGQVALPESLRMARHWEVGQEFTVTVIDDGILLTPKTLAEMEQAIAER